MGIQSFSTLKKMPTMKLFLVLGALTLAQATDGPTDSARDVYQQKWERHVVKCLDYDCTADGAGYWLCKSPSCFQINYPCRFTCVDPSQGGRGCGMVKDRFGGPRKEGTHATLVEFVKKGKAAQRAKKRR